MIRLLLYLLIVLLVFSAAMCGVQRCQRKREQQRTGTGRWRTEAAYFDTVRTALVPPVKSRGLVVVPHRTVVATRPDTALRKTMERGDIITGIERRRARRRRFGFKPRPPDSLVVQYVTPKGIVIENRYAWEVAAVGEFQIDSAGRLRAEPALREKEARREHRRQKAKAVVKTVTGTALAVGMAIAGWLILSR